MLLHPVQVSVRTRAPEGTFPRAELMVHPQMLPSLTGHSRCVLTSRNQLPASSCWRSVQLKAVLFKAALSGNTACTLVVLVSSSSCMRNGMPSALAKERRGKLCDASYLSPIPALAFLPPPSHSARVTPTLMPTCCPLLKKGQSVWKAQSIQKPNQEPSNSLLTATGVP